jgi:tetratricopeptide (TPR) repeat protein
MNPSHPVPTEAISIYNHALLLSGRGETLPAMSEYKRAISLYPQFLEAYNNLGEIYSKLGESENAVGIYLQALSIERNHRVLLNLGVEYYNGGKYQAALTHFRESIKNRDDFVEGQFYTALAYHNIKEMKLAEEHLLKVVALDRMHVKANYLLSSILYDRKEYARVIECLERIYVIADDKSFVNRYYGFCLYFLGRYSEAVDYLTKAMETNAVYSRFKDYLEKLTYENKLKEIGDIDSKIVEFETKVHKNKKSSLADCTSLAMLYIFNGEYRKAEDLLTPLQKKYKKAG